MNILHTKQMTAERRLHKAKVMLLRDPKFALWGGVLMMGTARVDDSIPSAYTDGRNEVYGRGFVQSLTDSELAFVVLHETLHKGLRDLTLWKRLFAKDARVAGMACDYVNNLMIRNADPMEETVAMPRYPDGKLRGLLDERFANMHAKQVFDILREELGDGQPHPEGEPTEGSDGQPSDEQGDGQPSPDGQLDEHDWEAANSVSKEEQEAHAKELDRAIRQGIEEQKKVGKGSANRSRAIDELLQPKVDWREVLREFVTATCSARDASSWRRVNRRFLSGDTYMPTLIGESVGHLVIGIDTSGSISASELTAFLSEIHSIAETTHPQRVDLMYWDSNVVRHEEYDGATVANIVSSTQPAGGGGTDPTCVHTHLSQRHIVPDAIVMFTDGAIDDWGTQWNAPILWVISADRYGNSQGIVSPVGKTVSC